MDINKLITESISQVIEERDKQFDIQQSVGQRIINAVTGKKPEEAYVPGSHIGEQMFAPDSPYVPSGGISKSAKFIDKLLNRQYDNGETQNKVAAGALAAIGAGLGAVALRKKLRQSKKSQVKAKG